MKKYQLAIPTYRPTKVTATVKAYDEHFSKFGHDIPIFVFDDSPDNRVFAHLCEIRTENALYVVGADEKKQFRGMLAEQARLKADERALLETMLRPSFGGNRNNMLLYTLGGYFITVDDDIRPYGLFTAPQMPGDPDVVLSGRNIRPDSEQYWEYETDITFAFMEVLGKRVDQMKGYHLGNHVEDPKVDLYTNKSERIAAKETCLKLRKADKEMGSAVIKVAETGLTGAEDVDSIDFAYFFIEDRDAQDPRNLTGAFAITHYEQFITSENWKNACGVSGYDNTEGLPSFLPTKLRFEDYVHRIWFQRQDVATAHVGAVQYHDRDGHERACLAKDILNEEYSNCLKKKLLELVSGMELNAVYFHPDGEVQREESGKIIEKALQIHKDFSRALGVTYHGTKRAENIRHFLREIEEVYHGFDHQTFHNEMQAVINRELENIIRAQELWPRCVEATFDLKSRGALPIRKLNCPPHLS